MATIVGPSGIRFTFGQQMRMAKTMFRGLVGLDEVKGEILDAGLGMFWVINNISVCYDILFIEGELNLESDSESDQHSNSSRRESETDMGDIGADIGFDLNECPKQSSDHSKIGLGAKQF